MYALNNFVNTKFSIRVDNPSLNRWFYDKLINCPHLKKTKERFNEQYLYQWLILQRNFEAHQVVYFVKEEYAYSFYYGKSKIVENNKYKRTINGDFVPIISLSEIYNRWS